MKRISIIVSILFISFITYIILAQDDKPKPVVAVLMLENQEKDSRLDVLCCTIKDTVSLTLKLMGKYRVIEDDNVIKYEKTDKIRQYAVDNKVDNVMFGRTLKNEKGQIIIQMSAYDKFQDSITITEQQEVDSIFEVFNAADELVVTLIEGFSGIRVAYGSIKLTNTGTEGDYTVFIDDQEIGDTLTAIDKVFVGKHRLRVTQKRVFEDLVLLKEDVLIEEEKQVTFEFAIPYLTAEEESEFNKLDRFVMANWDNWQKKQEVEDELVKVCGLLGQATKSAGLVELNDRYKKLYDYYKSLSSVYTYIDTKDISTPVKEDIERLALKKETVWKAEDIDELIYLKTAGTLNNQNKRYQTKPDWKLFSQLSANPVSIDPELINSITQPILDAVADRKPDFEDDFSENTGWTFNWPDDDEKYRKFAKYVSVEEGRLIIFSDQYYTEHELHYHAANPKMYFRNFILIVDAKFGKYSTNCHIDFRIKVGRGHYQVIISKDLRWFDFHYWNHNTSTKSEIYSGRLPYTDKDDYFSITLIANKDSFAAFFNNTPIMFVLDRNRISTPYITLTVYDADNVHERAPAIYYDNFKIWDLDKFNLE